MRDELVIVGRRIGMASVLRRRSLVVVIYLAFAGALVGCWFLDRGRHSSLWFLLTLAPLGRNLLGGYTSPRGEGVLKPFFRRPSFHPEPPPPYAALKLGLYRPSTPADALNDERELQQRDRAHTLAYRIVSAIVVLLWAASMWGHRFPNLASSFAATFSQLLPFLGAVAIAFLFTLPQAILLWTEPDIDPQP